MCNDETKNAYMREYFCALVLRMLIVAFKASTMKVEIVNTKFTNLQVCATWTGVIA